MKKTPTIYLSIVLLILISCQMQKKEPLTFVDYPGFKMGFTTQNFIEALPVNFENARSFIDYASANGYQWIELRDPEATLTLEEVEKLAAHAKEKEIEVSYAIQKGILDSDFWDVFNRGLNNAAVFTGQGPNTFRSLAGGNEFAENPEKKGWTKPELEELISRASEAAALAKEKGLQYVAENGTEAFHGQDTVYYGASDFFASTSPDVGWQFDTANPFSVSRVEPAPAQVHAFLEEYANRLHYIHLKSSVDDAAQTYLTQNPLDFKTIFDAMSKNNVNYIAVELQAVQDAQQVYQNMEKSIDFLRDQGFLK